MQECNIYMSIKALRVIKKFETKNKSTSSINNEKLKKKLFTSLIQISSKRVKYFFK